jgi:hypothetical protein
MTLRSASINSTSRRLRLNTWYSQTPWLMISAGNRCRKWGSGASSYRQSRPPPDSGPELVTVTMPQRRLRRLLGVLEQQLLDPSAPGYAVHDHYVARLLDLFDLVAAAYRLAVR